MAGEVLALANDIGLSSENRSTMTSELARGSIRYQCLVQVIERVLHESRLRLGLQQILADCYGEDAAIFQGRSSSREDDTASNVLQMLLENMLERMHEHVLNQTKGYLQEHQVEEKLLYLEKIIRYFQQEDRIQQLQEEIDQRSARRALGTSQLPKHVQPADVVKYQTFQQMQQERDRLVQELQRMAHETEQIELASQQLAQDPNSHLQKLSQSCQQLEETADLCSMIS